MNIDQQKAALIEACLRIQGKLTRDLSETMGYDRNIFKRIMAVPFVDFVIDHNPNFLALAIGLDGKADLELSPVAAQCKIMAKQAMREAVAIGTTTEPRKRKWFHRLPLVGLILDRRA